MPRVFISYRRSDSSLFALTLSKELQERLDPGSVFIDIDDIPPGVDFRTHIADAVARCDVLLVLIGDKWLKKTKGGKRRLDDARDFVRVEIESALKRDIPVIPVLIENATMPSSSELPPAIQDLAYRQAVEIRAGRDFWQHLERFVHGIAHRDSVTSEKSAPNVTVDQIRELLGDLTDPRLFFAPNIPDDELSNAIASYATGVAPSSVLLLFNGTTNQATPSAILRGIRVGFLFTPHSLYWRDTPWSNPFQLRYDEMETVELQKAIMSLTFFSHIQLNGEHSFTWLLPMSGDFRRRLSEVLEQLSNCRK
jgi:hypothetical protein